MIFGSSLAAGVFETAVCTSIPSYLATLPSVVDGTCTVFETFLAPPGRPVVFQAYLLVPTALVPENVATLLSQPVQAIGFPRLHLNAGRLEWQIDVRSIEFDACRRALAGPTDVGVLEFYLHEVPETRPFDRKEVAGTWIVYTADDPYALFW